jgi:hypothetical protein
MTLRDRERRCDQLLADAAGQIKALSAMLLAKDMERPDDVESWVDEVALTEAAGVAGALDAESSGPGEV